MKKIVIILLFVIGGFLGFHIGNIYKKQNRTPEIKEKKLNPKKKQIKKVVISSKSIFIPYWSLDGETLDLSQYDEAIYFGISANYQGINKEEIGYRSLPAFTKVSAGKKKFITLRMIDDDVNNFILENKDIQKKIILETLEIVEQNSLDGIVLDLEISFNLNRDLTGQINDFVQQFYSETSKDYREFYVTIYGDTFYRKRPFDLAVLTKNSDKIMVMAYDFHKSRGEPGPNFPYDSGAKYQYSFKNMLSDFLRFVPKEKLTVVFGMFGYDWLVDEKKRPITQAKALSLNEIRNKFLDSQKKNCTWKDCLARRDNLSKEMEINYIISSITPDDQKMYRIDYHIVWFEDDESAKIKTEYLQEQGIGSISYWAHGYF